MDFVGNEIMILREGVANYPMAFEFAPCSSALANDGAIPYGTVITAAELTAKDSRNVDITSIMSPANVIDGHTVTTKFTYSATAEKGRGKVFVRLTLSDGSVLAKRWDGLVIG